MQALPSRPALPVGIEEANCSVESEGAVAGSGTGNHHQLFAGEHGALGCCWSSCGWPCCAVHHHARFSENFRLPCSGILHAYLQVLLRICVPSLLPAFGPLGRSHEPCWVHVSLSCREKTQD